MTKPSNMFMAKSTYASTRVTGISVQESDTDSSHFSFAIYVDPEDFCKAIDEIITSYNDNSAYYVFQDITIRAVRESDTVRITRDCSSVYITRGNMKVMYAGCIGSLIGMTKTIRKAINKRDNAFNAEMEGTQ